MGKDVDLFLESMISAPLKDDQALMAFPFFSVQKRPRMEPILYDDGKVQIRITGGEKGIATIWDKDVLIYIATVVNDRLERGLPVDKKVRFNAYDLLRVCQRTHGKTGYERLYDALFRLRSTTIETSIVAGDQKERRGFGWIETWRIIERKNGNGDAIMAGIEVTLNDWMFRALVQDRRVLTISRAYFSLSSGLKRRLYEIARKHCGRQPSWKILLPKLATRCGVVTDLKYFKRELTAIVQANDLPDYEIAMSFDPKEKPRIERDGYDGSRWSTNERIVVRFWPRSSATPSVDNSFDEEI